MKAIEVTEQAVRAIEDAGTFSTGISSGLKLTCDIIRQHEAFKAACAAFKEYPAMIPVLLDKVAKYNQTDPGKYEHPNDVSVLAFLLLAEEVYGTGSMELRILMVVADLLPSPWWTRQFVERMRAPSQSGP